MEVYIEFKEELNATCGVKSEREKIEGYLLKWNAKIEAFCTRADPIYRDAILPKVASISVLWNLIRQYIFGMQALMYLRVG